MTCSKEGKISEAPEKQKNVAFPVRKKERKKLMKKKIKIMVIHKDSLRIIKQLLKRIISFCKELRGSNCIFKIA